MTKPLNIRKIITDLYWHHFEKLQDKLHGKASDFGGRIAFDNLEFTVGYEFKIGDRLYATQHAFSDSELNAARDLVSYVNTTLECIVSDSEYKVFQVTKKQELATC